MDRIRKYGIRFFIALVFCALVFQFFTLSTSNNPAKAINSGSIVMRADNYEILGGENFYARMPMASTTKIMTALIVVENCLMDENVVITSEAVGIEGSSIYLKVGETLTVKDLLFGLMLRSGNDSAMALAIHTAGSEEAFVAMMNLRAKSLGLKNTNFCNPHGLDDKNHYTCCYDLCYIGCFAMKYPQFREVVGTKFITVGNNEEKRYFQNKNKILSMYEGGNGIKTGYTKKSGRCLVASAERNGVLLISAVLNHGDMWNDCMSLLDYGFQKINT
ncbi:D-alanyl-D-alanine carboxypeptidase [bacterium]|nr:D-alanyl-D-alanine carboxypeptidase [bacterium]